MATCCGLLGAALGVMAEPGCGPEIAHGPHNGFGTAPKRSEIQHSVVDPVEVDHIGLLITRHRLNRQAHPTRAEGGATVKAISPQRQPIQLLQQPQTQLHPATGQHGSHSGPLGLRICGEELTLDPLGQQTLMQPEGTTRGTATEAPCRQVEDPQGANTR